MRHERALTVGVTVPRTWSGLPVAGVVRVVGVGRDELAVALGAAPADAPAVIGCRVGAGQSAADVVDAVTAHLGSVAAALFPAWLPGADQVDGAGRVDRGLVRRRALALASTTDHYGPFVAALADAALVGRPVAGTFPPEIRLRGLTRILRAAYGRDGLVLLLEPADAAVATAGAWLADHGGVGVWLLGAAVDRVAAAAPDLPEFVGRLTRDEQAAAPALDFPAVAGRPHPLSAAETRLESHLRHLPWARDRVWNQVHRTHPLAPPMRVDLMWPDARCVVEIDGPDHRGILKYADDRRRDNSLVLDGYAVLRFTNDEILGDAPRVLHVIERLVTTRRPQKGAAQ